MSKKRTTYSGTFKSRLVLELLGMLISENEGMVLTSGFE